MGKQIGLYPSSNSDVNKVFRTIISCQTMEHLYIAERMLEQCKKIHKNCLYMRLEVLLDIKWMIIEGHMYEFETAFEG